MFPPSRIIAPSGSPSLSPSSPLSNDSTSSSCSSSSASSSAASSPNLVNFFPAPLSTSSLSAAYLPSNYTKMLENEKKNNDNCNTNQQKNNPAKKATKGMSPRPTESSTELVPFGRSAHLARLLQAAFRSPLDFHAFCELLQRYGIIKDAGELLSSQGIFQHVKEMILVDRGNPHHHHHHQNHNHSHHYAAMSIPVSMTSAEPALYLPFNIQRYDKDFIELKRAGKGGFGSVFHVRHRLDGKEYCVKKIVIKATNFKTVFKRLTKLVREVRALAKLEHRNCVRYYGAWMEPTLPNVSDDTPPDTRNQLQIVTDSLREQWEESIENVEDDDDDDEDKSELPPSPQYSNNVSNSNNNVSSMTSIPENSCPPNPSRESSLEIFGVDTMITLFIQMEQCQPETLEATVVPGKDRVVDVTNYLNIIRQLTCGLQHVHSHGLCHRDLKPANCFFGKFGDAKIGDFGLAREFGAVCAGCGIQPCTADDHSSCDDLTQKVGTASYAAPEQFAGTGCTDKADVFSLGLVFLELFHPFSTGMERSQIMRNARAGILPDSFKQLYPEIAFIILRCLAANPACRPTAAELLSMLDELLPFYQTPLNTPSSPVATSSSEANYGDTEWERKTMQKMSQEIQALRWQIAALKADLDPKTVKADKATQVE